MAVNLEISASSQIMTMSLCRQQLEAQCGINYRAS